MKDITRTPIRIGDFVRTKSAKSKNINYSIVLDFFGGRVILGLSSGGMTNFTEDAACERDITIVPSAELTEKGLHPKNMKTVLTNYLESHPDAQKRYDEERASVRIGKLVMSRNLADARNKQPSTKLRGALKTTPGREPD